MKEWTAEDRKRYGDRMFEGGREHGMWEARLRIPPPWTLAIYTFAIGAVLGLGIGWFIGRGF